MNVDLYSHQLAVLPLLRSGSILNGGVGSGKSRTAIAYFFCLVCKGSLSINGTGETAHMKTPKNLVIITTAKKRDSLEWDKELAIFGLVRDNPENSFDGVAVKIDSWNNIRKYEELEDHFFIFDEQRLVGSGAWVKSFLKIAKKNSWIMLTATPGDTWSDYIPVFIANGFYKNRTEFGRRHIVYDRFSKYPKILRYLEEDVLEELRDKILVKMDYAHEVKRVENWIECSYNTSAYKAGVEERFDHIWKNEPFQDASGLCYYLRRVVNSDNSRFLKLVDVLNDVGSSIIFYNFDYELEILKDLLWYGWTIGQWNGHVHQALSEVSGEKRWVYLVQYSAGAEGWNCTETNSVIFWSLNYSYKLMKQAEGRIDRLDSPHNVLRYTYFYAPETIDMAIRRTLNRKGTFNEGSYEKGLKKGLFVRLRGIEDSDEIRLAKKYEGGVTDVKTVN